MTKRWSPAAAGLVVLTALVVAGVGFAQWNSNAVVTSSSATAGAVNLEVTYLALDSSSAGGNPNCGAWSIPSMYETPSYASLTYTVPPGAPTLPQQTVNGLSIGPIGAGDYASVCFTVENFGSLTVPGVDITPIHTYTDVCDTFLNGAGVYWANGIAPSSLPYLGTASGAFYVYANPGALAACEGASPAATFSFGVEGSTA